MKNDARFFFCLTGFVGFLLFYLIASLLHQNFAFSLMHGAIGCLCFAIYGRFLLGILLKNSIVQSTQSTQSSNSAFKVKDKPPSSRNPKPKSISRNQSPDLPSLEQPMVDTKV
jgi:hypothetical protein